jgi:CDP-4-dehydro-6-deoxyglucose reductase
MNELAKQWDDKYPNIHYRPVLSQGDESWQGRRGHVQQAVIADFNDLSEYELYACGHPDMVYTAKEMLVKAGMDGDYCYSDAFEYAKK